MNVMGLSTQELGLGSSDQVHTCPCAGDIQLCVHIAGPSYTGAGPVHRLSSLPQAPFHAWPSPEVQNARGHPKSQLSQLMVF